MKKSEKATKFLLCTVALVVVLFALSQVLPQAVNQRVSLVDVAPSTISLEALKSYYSLQSAPIICKWEFWVTDKNTSEPLPNVWIRIWFDDPLIGHGEYNVYTDVNGYGTVEELGYQWNYVNLTKYGYVSYQFGPVDSRTFHLQFHLSLTANPSVPPRSSVSTLILYIQYDNTRNRVWASATVNKVKYLFSCEDYPEKIVVDGLSRNASYSVLLDGNYQTNPENGYSTAPFHFTINLKLTSATSEFWVDPSTENVGTGKPPYVAPPADYWSLLTSAIAWLTQYWLVVVIVGVALYLAPTWLPLIVKLQRR
jgi:hypothetical protein